MYIGDMKIYASNVTHMKGLLKIIDMVFRDINLDFDMSECKEWEMEP